MREAFRDLGGWQTSLRGMVNQLQHLEIRAKRAVAEDLGIDARALRVPREAPHEAGSEDDDSELSLGVHSETGDGGITGASDVVENGGG